MDLPGATSMSWHSGQQTIQSKLDISWVYDDATVPLEALAIKLTVVDE